MERNFVKGVISKLLAKSYNYVTCTHDPKARSMCDAAEKYSKSSSEWDEKMTILSKSRFCPRPESDPDLVCQVEKWYFSVNQQHSRAMNGLSMIESFQGDSFKLRRNELFQEAYDNYVRCGNACTNFDWHKGPFSRDMTFTGSFHLPICQNDQLNLVDFTRYWGWNAHPGMSWYGYGNGEWSSWNFPAVCGDHHASETRGFLEAMNAGMRSDVYSHHYFYRATDQLWRDRIPRVSSHHFLLHCDAYLLRDSNSKHLASHLTTTSWLCVRRGFICQAANLSAKQTARSNDLLSRVRITDVTTLQPQRQLWTSLPQISGSAWTQLLVKISKMTHQVVRII